MRTNTAITFYNRFVDPATRSELFQRSVISQCYFESLHAARYLQGGTLIMANVATVYIPMMANIGNYLHPVDWLALSNKVGKFTFSEGDLVVQGVVTDELSADFTPTDLKARYPDVYSILSVDDQTMGSRSLWHWQVGLK